MSEKAGKPIDPAHEAKLAARREKYNAKVRERKRRRLADAGFALAELRPVGQFRWSTHVELASLFVR